TEAGGITAHSSILARSFEIPAVIGVNEITQFVNHNDTAMVDGYAGYVIFNPSEEKIELFKIKRSEEEGHRRELGQLVKIKTSTKDGRKIHLLSNCDSPEEVDSAMMVGSEGIGLVRSEHLVLALNYFPDEQEQYKWYSEIAQRAYPNMVTIRAFDVGSDKYAEGMSKHENNPALGFRGIRFLLHREDLFITQIRAILRASKNKNIRIMLPMVSNLSQIESSKVLIEKCKDMLRQENELFDSQIPVGIMIETPAAALLAEKFAENCDFFSIGTNDLTQYTLAADRTNELVTGIYDSFHPAVLKLIKSAVDGAKKKNIPVGVCGELAGHTAATELLIGLGIDELSTVPSILLELKSRILKIKYSKSKKIAKEILNCNSFYEVTQKLQLV
ncbi:MAG: phosphoenolpyruvate--protein phosphotransferase, partial [Bacteroidota bacterium]